MKRKYILFSFITMFTFTTILLAQRRPPQLPDDAQVAEMVKELASMLNLNPEQTEKINSLFEAHFKAARKLMDKAKEQNEKQDKIMDRLRNEFESDVKSLLNEKQQAEFDQFMKTRLARPRGPRPDSN